MIANKKSLLALSVASALMLSGCFSDDDNNVTITPPPPEPTDPVVVAPEAPAELSFVVNVAVIDDENSDAIDATVRFLESGQPATNLVDANGEQVQSVQTGEDGGFVITRKDGSSITSFTAVVSAEGYVSKSFNIDISNEDELKVINADLALISIDDEDIEEKSATGAVANGDTGEEIKTEGETATASLPQGTQLLDANEQPITEGDEASLSVVSVSPTSTKKASLVPEGLNDTAENDVAIPVSVADINMLVGDTKVKNFGNDQKLSVTLSAPELNLGADEQLQVSSFNEDTGEWVRDEFEAVYNDVDDTVTASFETDHLTFFAVTRKQAICENPVAANITGTVPTGGLVFTAVSSDAAFSAPIPPGTSEREFISAGNAKRYGIAADASARIKVRDREGGVWFETQNEVAICAEDPIEISLVAPFTLVDKQLTLAGTCANDGDVEVDLSNSTVKYKRSGKGVRTALKDSDGNFQLTNLREGEDYQVTINFRGVPVVESNTFTIEGADAEDLTQAFTVTCPTTTGSTGTTGGS